MNTQTAATATRAITPSTPAVRAEGGQGASHAFWMLEGIILGYVQHENAHRWLGYAQAILIYENHLDLPTAKQINKDS